MGDDGEYSRVGHSREDENHPARNPFLQSGGESHFQILSDTREIEPDTSNGLGRAFCMGAMGQESPLIDCTWSQNNIIFIVKLWKHSH